MLPEKVKQLAAILSNLPGIGPRQAIRLAIHISKSEAFKSELLNTLESLADTKQCSQCFFIHDRANDLCLICSDKNRDQETIAIVEKITDLLSLEQSGTYKGRYLVLGTLKRDGMLNEGHKEKINLLKQQFGAKKAKEIILCLSPSNHGEINSATLESELKKSAEKITRLATGIPTGGDIEFADEKTLEGALKNRS
ncbi:MAG: toprim domain-containing protein [bacterium]|nr:toprim domain-containing protein [bacterium]